METDGELIGRSSSEPSAFEAVFDRHYEGVRLYAQRLVGRSDGEEIAAATFETAFANRTRFDAERYSSALPWLIGIAHNLARHHLRHEHVRRKDADRRSAEVNDPFEFSLEAEDARRLGPAIRAALATLSESDRETFLLHALAELSGEEIAQIVGVPPGTVRSRLNRARRVLREQLATEEAMQEGGE